MKNIKYILSYFLALFILFGCNNEEDNFDYLDDLTAPANVNALFQVTQDNTGLVTITPNSEGAVSYKVTYGDATAEAASVKQGSFLQHTYAEGSYSVKIEALGITGLKSEITKELIVSFKAPENLIVTIQNDVAVSKQVNVTATADFGMFYEVYFGEPGIDEPVIVNMGETAHYIYENAGTYNIKVIAKSAAIETTEFTETFLVTAILQPLESARRPSYKQDSDVISIFSDAYTNVSGTDFYPNWGQSTTYTAFNLNGDAMIQYTDLNYQGIDLGSSVDASSMETLHIDIWTAEDTSIDIYPLPNGIIQSDERFVTKQLIANQWNSFDIPLTDFTSQGLSLNDIKQFKFVGNPVGETLFIDNIYFWKAASSYVPLIFDDFDGNSNITTWAQDASVLTIGADNIYNNGINTSLKVLKYDDNGSGEYANIRFDAAGNFDLTTASTFTLKLYVPSSSVTGNQANTIQLKLQNGTIGEPWSSQSVIEKSFLLDTWQEITFDFASDAILGQQNPITRTDFNRVVLQLNGEGNFDKVIGYIDDFAYGPTPPADAAPFATDDFEGATTIAAWIPDAMIIDAAFPIGTLKTGMNYSNTVLKYDDDGSGQYANVNFNVTPNFNLNQKNKFTLKLYVPTSGITGSQINKIQLKLQDGTAGEPWALQSAIEKTIVLDQWQEITFDFGSDTLLGDQNPLDRTDFNRVVIQLNGEGNSDKVIGYIDDFKYHN